MRFSIRTLLALAVIAALGMLAWRSHRDAKLHQLFALELALQIETLEQKLHVHDPELHQAVMGVVDQSDTLHEIRVRSEQAFPSLVDKYGSIEPHGVDVFTIRSLPALRTDAGRGPLKFRLVVPEQRPVWLKFGVRQTKRNSPSGLNPGADDDLLQESPFEHTGPYEMRLPPGDQVLTVAVNDAQQGALPFSIMLDERTLMQSEFRASGVCGSGFGALSVPQQSDFHSKRPLPSLIDIRMYLRDKSGKRTEKSFAFSIWLSDEASDFEEFPGE